jgi:hypothetical protein
MLAFIDLETRVPPDHPLRVIKELADQALKKLSPDLERMYAVIIKSSSDRCELSDRDHCPGSVVRSITSSTQVFLQRQALAVLEVLPGGLPVAVPPRMRPLFIVLPEPLIHIHL